MTQIEPIVPPFDQLLGEQRLPPDTPVRLLTFVIPLRVKEGMLLFNNLTKAMALLSPNEADLLGQHPEKMQKLVRQWFLVPQTHDDGQLAREMRTVGNMLRPPVEALTDYTIFTTTDCNARCFYCYQKGTAHISMSRETATETARYILRHSAGKKVSLAWFGGEPLYNKEAISIICRNLQEAAVPYASTMTTNGFLLDRNILPEAKELWKLESVQITLDGTEEIYNRAKQFIYHGVNAYRKVMENIGLLLEADLSVRIRLNMDLYNADDLCTLAHELGRSFGGQKELGVYSHPLFGKTVGNATVYDDEKRKQLYAKKAQLREILKSYRIQERPSLKLELRLNQCMADNDRSITILPDGRIGKCEHFTDSHFIGHIGTKGFDNEIVNAFKQLQKDSPACASCPLYPECIRLEECPTNEHCFPELQEEKMTETREEILRFYHHWRKNHAVQD